MYTFCINVAINGKHAFRVIKEYVPGTEAQDTFDLIQTHFPEAVVTMTRRTNEWVEVA